MIVIDAEQGGDEWAEYRLGIPSASRFKDVLAGGAGKTRRKYLLEKVSEVLTGQMPEQYVNDHMLRGIEQEPEARALYELVKGVTAEEVGLALLDDKSACASPDGLVGDDGGIEIKSVIPTVHIETILSGKMPTSHMAQVQGNMWIWDRQWWDFVSYSPLIADNPIQIFRADRDEEYIDKLKSAVTKFNEEVQQTATKIRGE